MVYYVYTYTYQDVTLASKDGTWTQLCEEDGR